MKTHPRLLIALLLSACVSAAITPPSVPDPLAAPETEVVALKVFASGTQNYVCKETSPGTFAWTLQAPEATLYSGDDTSSAVVGTHSAGPTWQSAADGSKFVGDAPRAAKADAPDGKSIPWLLVPKKSADPAGEFAAFTFVQRVSTSGGKAAASGCDASSGGKIDKVPYTANYYFYKSK